MASSGRATSAETPSRCFLASFWDTPTERGPVSSGHGPTKAPLDRTEASAADDENPPTPSVPTAFPVGTSSRGGNEVAPRTVFIPAEAIDGLVSILFAMYNWCALEQWRAVVCKRVAFSKAACWSRSALVHAFSDALSADDIVSFCPMRPYRRRTAVLVGSFWDNYKSNEVGTCPEHDHVHDGGLFVQSHPLFC